MVHIGYDMHMKGTVPGEAEALAGLEPLYRDALAVRDAFPAEARGNYQEGVDEAQFMWGRTFANADPQYAAAQAKVIELGEEKDRLNRSYFRLNIWGMASYRDVMEAVGMGYWEDMPDWPKPDAFGFENEEELLAAQEALEEGNGDLAFDHGYDGVVLTQDMLDRAREYQAAGELVKEAHPSETPGIPLNKFCSNDGWHVTAVECSSALEIFGRFIRSGYPTTTLTWQEALAAFRTADPAERAIVATIAMVDAGLADAKVGHGGWTSEEEENRPTVQRVLSEEYFLQWLQYLEDGTVCDGFEVY